MNNFFEIKKKDYVFLKCWHFKRVKMAFLSDLEAKAWTVHLFCCSGQFKQLSLQCLSFFAFLYLLGLRIKYKKAVGEVAKEKTWPKGQKMFLTVQQIADQILKNLSKFVMVLDQTSKATSHHQKGSFFDQAIEGQNILLTFKLNRYFDYRCLKEWPVDDIVWFILH